MTDYDRLIKTTQDYEARARKRETRAADEAAQAADFDDVRAWEIALECRENPGLLAKIIDYMNEEENL